MITAKCSITPYTSSEFQAENNLSIKAYIQNKRSSLNLLKPIYKLHSPLRFKQKALKVWENVAVKTSKADNLKEEYTIFYQHDWADDYTFWLPSA